jgi:hypothetical protein
MKWREAFWWDFVLAALVALVFGGFGWLLAVALPLKLHPAIKHIDTIAIPPVKVLPIEPAVPWPPAELAGVVMNAAWHPQADAWGAFTVIPLAEVAEVPTEPETPRLNSPETPNTATNIPSNIPAAPTKKQTRHKHSVTRRGEYRHHQRERRRELRESMATWKMF